ncbi:nitroreductase family protein [Maribacter hydrothermalis]|uniref:Putative NAD(P)H nitroreductase n=1 Tax=Maribacter hydrothermalis TaxID=1836467 RepID=A0A1B7ZFV3_9FLAO|nr:nitroreductase [Maribacter hydrothermalis]APQ19318.1 nitroreductase [Maribacter hydrothermalis]OBR42414.1 nitroreductase [Maribacter hydrothermalis]
MIFDIIKKRRSVFPVQYNDVQIETADIEKVLEAANWAPNHKCTEPWRFKVIQGDAKGRLGTFLSKKYEEVDPRPKAIKIKKLQENPQRASAIIAICMQRDTNESLPEWEEVAAVAMAVQNMWLQCTEMGIGCYWSSPGLIKYMDEFLTLAEGEKCLGFFYMGNFDGELSDGKRGPIEAKTEWIS